MELSRSSSLGFNRATPGLTAVEGPGRDAGKEMSHTPVVRYAASITVTAAMLLAAGLLGNCHWQPQGREATATLTMQAFDLTPQSEIRVRFYEGDSVLTHISEQGGQFGGLSYGNGLQQLSPASVAGATEHTFTMSRHEGTLAIAGIPVNTPYTVVLERLGAHDNRLGGLELGQLGVSNDRSQYAENIEFLSHIGFSSETFEIAAGDSATLEIQLSQTALGTLDLYDVEGNSLILAEDFDTFFELVGVPSGEEISIDHLVGTGGHEDFISPWLINAWYEESVRERVVRPVSAADSGSDDPRELLDPSGEFLLVNAVLPGRRFQLMATNVENRDLDEAFGGGGSVGVSEPFTLRPGETRDLEITVHTIGEVLYAP